MGGCFWYTDRSPEASQDPMLSIKINNKYHFSTKMEYVFALSYICVLVEIQQPVSRAECRRIGKLSPVPTNDAIQ
jgi:hypothetical protein